MSSEVMVFVAANPLASALALVVLLTAGAVGTTIVLDIINQRRLAVLQAQLAELEAERERLKGQL